MFVPDDKESRHGAESSPVPTVLVSGSMSQILMTDAGASYRLAYESYGDGFEAECASACGICDVIVDGSVVQTIVAVSGHAVVSHEALFTAQSDETVLTFSSVGRVPFRLGSATASKVAKPVF